MKKFLVTGGAGFIGSHITEELVKRKYFVRVLDNFSSGKEKNLKGFIHKIELIKGDIRSEKTCQKATKGMDYVLHQAALRSVPKSLLCPDDYNAVNIQGTLNLLRSSSENKVKRLVFASSSSIYGDIKDFPEKEDFNPQPISPYALSKLTGEHYCRIFSRHFGLSTVALRYFNVFGPRQSLDDEYAVVIPKFIHCILTNQSMPIYGNGRQSRDFTYVANVVDANILAAGTGGLGGEAFNIACGKDYTVLELAGVLNRILDKDIKPTFLEKRAGDVFKTEADISFARSRLGYKPSVDFMRGLRLTTEYFKND